MQFAQNVEAKLILLVRSRPGECIYQKNANINNNKKCNFGYALVISQRKLPRKRYGFSGEHQPTKYS